MEDGLVHWQKYLIVGHAFVLILVVVEDGLVQGIAKHFNDHVSDCLNPCCSGRWSRTSLCERYCSNARLVLILVVVEDGLVPVQGKDECITH